MATRYEQLIQQSAIKMGESTLMQQQGRLGEASQAIRAAQELRAQAAPLEPAFVERMRLVEKGKALASGGGDGGARSMVRQSAAASGGGPSTTTLLIGGGAILAAVGAYFYFR